MNIDQEVAALRTLRCEFCKMNQQERADLIEELLDMKVAKCKHCQGQYIAMVGDGMFSLNDEGEQWTVNGYKCPECGYRDDIESFDVIGDNEQEHMPDCGTC